MNHSKLFFPFFILLLASTTFAQTSVGLSSPTNKTLDVVVQNENGALSYIAWTGKAWSEWQALESPPNTNLSVQTISVQSGRTEIIGISDKGSVYHAFLKNDKLSEWQVIGLYTKSFPEVVSWGKGRFDVFITSKKGEILHTYFTNGNWSKRWKNHGGNVRGTQSPSVVAQAKGKLDIFYRSRASLIKHKSWNKNAWSDWETVPGMKLSSPVVASSMANGRLDLFTRGSKGEVMNSSKIFGRWSKWVNIGKDISGQKGIQVHKRGENLDIFYINRPGQLLHQTANSKGRSKWSVVGKTNQLPSTTSWSSNRTDISFLNGKGELQQAYFNGKKWSSLRNKGKFKLPQMDLVVNPTIVPPSIINIPIQPTKYRLDNLTKFPKYKLELEDGDENEKNMNSSNSANKSNVSSDQGYWGEDDGFMCKTFAIPPEERESLEDKIIGEVPSGIVPGAIIDRNTFISSNYRLVIDAPVRRNEFSIKQEGVNDQYDEVEIKDFVNFVSYSQINAEIDKAWRKPNLNDTFDSTIGVETKENNINISRSLFKFDISAKYLGSEAKFSLEKKKYKFSKTLFFYQEQKFFTAVAVKDNTVEWIKDNPDKENLLLVDEVTYGRQFLIKIEEKLKEESKTYEAMLKSNFGVNAEADFERATKSELKEYTLTVYTKGGDELEGLMPLGAMTGKYNNIDEALDAIKANKPFSNKNRGYPISYTLMNLDTGHAIKFKYSAPLFEHKTLCIPQETEYLIMLKKIKVGDNAGFSGDQDKGPELEFTGNINVTLGTTSIGDLLTEDTDEKLGPNPYKTSNRGRVQMLQVNFKNSQSWTYTPGYIRGDRKNGLPKFRLTTDLLDQDAELNFIADLQEHDKNNRNESFGKATQKIKLRKLVAENPNLHDFGIEHVLNFNLTGDANTDISLVVEFIPISSSVERLPLYSLQENERVSIGFVENDNSYQPEADVSSSLSYTRKGDDLCLSNLETSRVTDDDFKLLDFEGIAPGTLFKVPDLIENDYFNEVLPDSLKRKPINITIERLTSVGSSDNLHLSKTLYNNIQTSTINDKLKEILGSNVRLYPTGNSNINIIVTKSAKQALFAAGLRVNSVFANADMNFFRESSSERETVYAIIEREFFKASARQRPIRSGRYNYKNTWTTIRDVYVSTDANNTNSSNTDSTSPPVPIVPADPEIIERQTVPVGLNEVSGDHILRNQDYAYVGEVTYGEKIIIKFETRYSEAITDLKAKISANYFGIGGSVSTDINSFKSDSTTNVQAIYYGSRDYPRQINEKQDVLDVLDMMTENENRFNPSDNRIGKPISFKAYRVGSNEPLANFKIDKSVSSNYFCAPRNFSLILRMKSVKPIGPWRDRDRQNNIELAGKIRAFAILDKGIDGVSKIRSLRSSPNLFNTNGNALESISTTDNNEVPLCEGGEDSEDYCNSIRLFFTTNGLELSYKDIINGKLHLQFDIQEVDKKDKNEKFYHISRDIPFYELIPKGDEPKEVKVIMETDKTNKSLEFTLEVRRDLDTM